MKIRISTLLLFLSATLFINCNSDNEIPQAETINGTWNLKNVNGGFTGVDVNYENETVTWQFNAKTETLTVKSTLINNGPQSTYLPLQSGTYNYYLSEANGKTFVHIKDFGIHTDDEYGSYSVQDGVLIINQNEGFEGSAVDTFVLTFN
ncbi:hypothetical protein C7448_1127 [Tenacibaculum gallaicum]|uniref:Lipocalin-like protein n=1 Tax=Tenacibaculum gallaicum TaxID=561505 RepID=A0A3E0HF39_9FLAO|nr:hypothetical protein [Tenacibaculum gallaicum]REH43901.1 hypothetical protein C7448_1127 [Tenacibaculum gallaicum]